LTAKNDEVEGKGRKDSERNICRRTSRGNQGHAAARISQCTKIDRHGFGIAKQKR
jgi:hypothetical protein